MRLAWTLSFMPGSSLLGHLQGPILALADASHGHPHVVCLILKLASDVVEANISLLEVSISFPTLTADQ